MSEKSKIVATWVVRLNCECPKCKKYVDLLDHVDFWDGRSLQICEHGTKRSNALDVVCPDCDHEFEVFCEY